MKITIASKLDWEVTPHRDYDVLELDVLWKEAAGDLAYFRIIGDRGSVEYIPFKIVVSSVWKQDVQACSLPVPSGWTVDLKPGLICTIGPRELSREAYQGEGSFWEDFYDDEGTARLILSRILKERYPESYVRYVDYYGDTTEDVRAVGDED